MEVEKTASNVIDAAAAGAADGLRLALNIGAMLLAFIALIALINWPLTWLGDVTGLAAWLGKPTDLAAILGYVLAPIAWVIGVPWADATTVGALIGQKIVLNEFVAYLQLADIVNGKVAGVALSDQGTLIATYALCGFANFSSIAIQIGGIGGLAPERRSDLARFGLRAVLGGSLATLMTATIAGVLTSLGGMVSCSLRAIRHADRPLSDRAEPGPGADGGRHRQAVPHAVQAAGRGPVRVGDDHQRPALVEHREIAAPHGPRRRAGAGQRADRRHRPGSAGRRRALQRRPRRADHRHQHGLPGEEGVQRLGRLGADAGRGAGGAHPRRGGAGGRRAGDAEDPHRLGPRQPQRRWRSRASPQDCGIAALAVHGRTRADQYQGDAEYDTIAAIKAGAGASRCSPTATSIRRTRRARCCAAPAPTR